MHLDLLSTWLLQCDLISTGRPSSKIASPRVAVTTLAVMSYILAYAPWSNEAITRSWTIDQLHCCHTEADLPVVVVNRQWPPMELARMIFGESAGPQTSAMEAAPQGFGCMQGVLKQGRLSRDDILQVRW